MGLNAKDDGSKFRHDQAERLRDHDVPPVGTQKQSKWLTDWVCRQP